MHLLTVDTCTMLKQHNSENFTVSGCIKWLGEPVKPEHATKMVREAEITDPTGAINLLIWDSHIQQIKGEKFYTVTNCKLKQYYGNALPPQYTQQLPKHKSRTSPMLSH